MNRFHRWYCASARWRKRLEGQVFPWVVRDTDLGSTVLEVGPGPGLVTAVLSDRYPSVVAVEIDDGLSTALRARMRGRNVHVVRGDGAALPLRNGVCTGAVSFTMLHHVPTIELQDRLLAEVRRTLAPGAPFVGSDSMSGALFVAAHVFDTMVVVDPDSFGERLERVGFNDVKVRKAKNAFRFFARRPYSSGGVPV